jgi:predicted transcriptional regulator
MSIRRSKLEIQLEVLKAIRAGVDKPTRIMYAANISWNPVSKMLEDLVGRGLISVNTNGGNGSKRRYEITEKGISVVNYFEGGKEFVEIM